MRWCGLILNGAGSLAQASQMAWKGVRHRSALRCLAKLHAGHASGGIRSERTDELVGGAVMSAQISARTYNQNHIPRKYTSGKRRLSIYWTWSYPWESQRDPAAMENRFSTMTEVRN